MKISLTDAGKRFNRDWIFRHFNYNFESANSYAITGPNGSGKSTLLQVLSGNMLLAEGKISFNNGSALSTDNIYSKVSICAPYLELIEEMTLTEFLNFHKGFKPFLKKIDTTDIIGILDLEKAKNKQVRYFSSGMKQRLKLGQAIFSDTAIVLLDEPCTNLDTAGVSLYHRLIHDYCKERLVIVSSNDEVEFNFCRQRISIMDFKS
jgi:ABC-type multidrug transport system ATPase subunit